MKLIWLDAETTGLNPRTDGILEISVYVADLRLPFVVSSVFTAPVRAIVEDLGQEKKIWIYDRDHVKDLRPRILTPFIEKMHTKNGLLKDCAGSLAMSLPEIERVLLDRIPAAADGEEMPTLAGSCIHFDHEFLKVHMPKLAARFHYRHFDVSSVALFARSQGMPCLPKSEAHRAREDVLESVENAQRCARWLKGDGPTDEAPSNVSILRQMLEEHESVRLVVNTQSEGVVLPKHIKDAAAIQALDYSLYFSPPIPDLIVDEEAISATLSFNGKNSYTVIPWGAILSVQVPAAADTAEAPAAPIHPEGSVELAGPWVASAFKLHEATNTDAPNENPFTTASPLRLIKGGK